MSYIDEVGDQEYMELMEEEYRINQKKKKVSDKKKPETNGSVMEVEEVFREEESEGSKLRSESEEIVYEESD